MPELDWNTVFSITILVVVLPLVLGLIDIWMTARREDEWPSISRPASERPQPKPPPKLPPKPVQPRLEELAPQEVKLVENKRHNEHPG